MFQVKDKNILLNPQANDNFVETDYIKEITQRALGYIQAGFPIHFRGPAGTGKTTIAKHIAAQLQRPTVILHGDNDLNTTNMIGGEYGVQSKQLIDNFISSVLKKEESIVKQWVDNRLTVACKYGFTLIYDEFTRSRPEANNIFLSILEERIMNLPISRGDEDPYIPVHPNFTAIFTSNPDEYAGVHKTQDALKDRLITIDLSFFDYETEFRITKAKSNLPDESVNFIINVIKSLREATEFHFAPTLRNCLMIAKSIKALQIDPFTKKDEFAKVCQDVLGGESLFQENSFNNYPKIKNFIRDIVFKQKIKPYKETEPSFFKEIKEELVLPRGKQEYTLNGNGNHTSYHLDKETVTRSKDAKIIENHIEKEEMISLQGTENQFNSNELENHLNFKENTPDQENGKDDFIHQVDRRLSYLKNLMQNL